MQKPESYLCSSELICGFFFHATVKAIVRENRAQIPGAGNRAAAPSDESLNHRGTESQFLRGPRRNCESGFVRFRVFRGHSRSQFPGSRSDRRKKDVHEKRERTRKYKN